MVINSLALQTSKIIKLKEKTLHQLKANGFLLLYPEKSTSVHRSPSAKIKLSGADPSRGFWMEPVRAGQETPAAGLGVFIVSIRRSAAGSQGKNEIERGAAPAAATQCRPARDKNPCRRSRSSPRYTCNSSSSSSTRGGVFSAGLGPDRPCSGHAGL